MAAKRRRYCFRGPIGSHEETREQIGWLWALRPVSFTRPLLHYLLNTAFRGLSRYAYHD
jgi:hypothetical protein